MKILILRFSSIGDIIFTTPAVRCLRKKYPLAVIDFMTKVEFKVLLEHNPYIDNLKLLEEKQNLMQWVQAIKKEKYDYILDFHNNLRSHVICFFQSSKVLRFSKNRALEKKMINQKKFPQKTVHVAERLINMLSPLGVENDFKTFDFFLPKDTSKNEDIIRNIFGKEKYVLFIIGASTFTKRMPNKVIIDLLSQFQKKVILVGGKDVEKNGQYIEQSFSNNDVVNKCGVWDISQTVVAIQQAESVIGFDTGLSHITQSLDKKLAIILGGTDYRVLGVEPYHFTSYITSEVNLPCRPCSKFGLNACPEKHFKCMKNHDLNRIATFINSP